MPLAIAFPAPPVEEYTFFYYWAKHNHVYTDHRVSSPTRVYGSSPVRFDLMEIDGFGNEIIIRPSW